jgi:hypothetical protein
MRPERVNNWPNSMTDIYDDDDDDDDDVRRLHAHCTLHTSPSLGYFDLICKDCNL